MQDKIIQLQTETIKKIESVISLEALDQVRVSILGKNGELTALLKELSALSPEAKKEMGMLLNTAKSAILEKIETKKQFLETQELNKKLLNETVDVSLPFKKRPVGRVHPIMQVMDEMLAIFGQMGFVLASGPDIEDDFHNFEALNVPKNHPARSMQDTFFIAGNEDTVLRTQTSACQIRFMEKVKPPVKMVATGRCYRREFDATHSPMFHQIEGLYVDKNVTVAHLKGCIEEFTKIFFNDDTIQIRLRPSYFPFTEPSFECDVACPKNLKGLLKSDWLEVFGCGMVHPNVLKCCGIDPNEYQGFAFGAGVDRYAMLKYGIPDIRPLMEGDMRFLNHYGFMPLDIPGIVSGLMNNGGNKR